jgi:hypothetical protein
MESFQKQLQSKIAALATEITVGMLMHQLLPPTGSSPLYAVVVRTSPASFLSNLTTPMTRSYTPFMATDTLYCTIDMTKVEEKDKGRKDLGKIRDAIKKEMRTVEGQDIWRCLAIMQDPRNWDRIRITGRTEEELERVKKVL